MSEITERVSLHYQNLSQKFSSHCTDYNRQYCSIYLSRLKDMENLLQSRIKKKWGDVYPICKLHKLTEENYEKCVVIGTLFKDQKLKPSVLKQLAEANQLVPQPILTHFTDDSDVLFIEDEVQRYQVLGTLQGQKVVTGITCALLGSDIGKGKFMVEDYVFVDFREQVPRPFFEESVFIIFLSGLDFINHEKFIPNLELFTCWISGMLQDRDTISKIARVIIAGNSIKTETKKSQPSISMTSRVAESADTIEAVKTFDYFLLKLCEVVDVDVMPGEHDPSNHILPQLPMHYCMFPQSSTYKSMNQVSNPYVCSLNDVIVMGTSGQPIQDIINFSETTDSLEAMDSCLKWNHLAPTAPDTLGCFPYYDNDPFIIDQCPHVFFAGNQKEFSTKIVKGESGQEVCLISVPQFSTTFQAVMLNLKNMECKTISFKTENNFNPQ